MDEINYLRRIIKKRKNNNLGIESSINILKNELAKAKNCNMVSIKYNVPKIITNNSKIKSFQHGNVIRIYSYNSSRTTRLCDYLINRRWWFKYDEDKIEYVIKPKSGLISKLSGWKLISTDKLINLNENFTKHGIQENFQNATRVSITYNKNGTKIYTLNLKNIKYPRHLHCQLGPK